MSKAKKKNENNVIHETRDYSMFKTVKGNRTIDKGHVKRLVREMKKKDLELPIFINENDEVVGMVSVNDMDTNILVVSENGFGKRSNLEDYRMTNRGGKGVKTISITEKTGSLVTLKNVIDEDDLMIINKSGIAPSP